MSKRYILLASTTAAMLMAGPVLAQTSGTRAPATSPAVTSPSHMTPAPATGAVTTGKTTMADDTTYMTADQKLRASKLIGSSVYNDQNQKIGSIDELLVDQNHDITSAVLSVGGFLGMGSKLVKVPYQTLHVANDKIVMAGASKDELKGMPTYSFDGAS